MAGADPRDAEDVAAEKPLDPAQVARWDWLEEAEQLVAAAVDVHGAGRRQIDTAYARAEEDPALQDAVAELALFVEALGGRLHLDPASGEPVTAAFAAGTVRLPPCQPNRGRR